jgi:enoyl-CoA hydratase/3-hydroxyacyl-CoA dehydrogenase
MAKPHVTMEVGNDGVAVVTLINPPVNALAIPSKYHLLPLSVLTINLRFFFVIDCVEFDGDAVIAGLKEKFDEATRRNDVKALVLTGNLFYNTD